MYTRTQISSVPREFHLENTNTLNTTPLMPFDADPVISQPPDGSDSDLVPQSNLSFL